MRAALPLALFAAPLGFLVFSSVWIVAGAVRPGYSAARHPVSSLALPPHGGWQVASFVVTGAFFAVSAFGLKAVGPALPWKSLAAVAAGLIGAGLFRTDPVNGYPPGTPPVTPPTPTGVMHRVLSAPVFLGLPVHLFGWGDLFRHSSQPRFAIAAVVALTAYLVCFAMMNAAFNQIGRLSRIAGGLQRACLLIGLGWLAALPWWVDAWKAG